MDALYPNLHDRFKTEGICPICLMEMELTPRYSCANGHTICYRCKPYYYGCPTCLSPLDIEIPPAQVTSAYTDPPPTHYMPHPSPRYRIPSAPPADFLEQERRSWTPPTPNPEQELIPCSYTHLGCWLKIPEYLKELHESRCQFRPHLEEEQLPTDLNTGHDELVDCRYSMVGCKIRLLPWRKSVHEKYCVYKDRYNPVNDISEGVSSVVITDDDGDPEELVWCKYRRYGCMVRMPRRRKYVHELKCNYSKYGGDEEEEEEQEEEEENHDYPGGCIDLEERVDCKWAAEGCRVRPKFGRKDTHEEKCNYRMEECSFKDYGCGAIFQPSQRYAHERMCAFAH